MARGALCWGDRELPESRNWGFWNTAKLIIVSQMTWGVQAPEKTCCGQWWHKLEEHPSPILLCPGHAGLAHLQSP